MVTEPRITHVLKRTGEIVPFDQEKITVAIYKAMASVGLHDRALAERLSDDVVSHCNQRPGSEPPSVEEVQDLVERTLILAQQAETAKAYILYREERARLRKDRSGRISTGGLIPYQVLWWTLDWNVTHGCHTVAGLNDWVRGGKFGELVRAAENLYREQIERAASAVMERLDDVRMIIVAGPSSSGKTTCTAKVAERLRERGYDLVALNLDHYFFDLELHPRDEFGDYDYETPEALDLNLINEHLAQLIAGKTIRMPYYNFQSGKREWRDGREFRLGEKQILLIDTLHGLFAKLTESVPDRAKFKLYIETFSQLKDNDGRFVRWTDIRLLRRMVRDMQFRNHPPVDTVGHWHYVRRSEMKHILPFLGSVDFIFNGSLCYELPVLKHFAFQYFPECLARFKNNPEREDAYIRAQRVHRLLDQIETLTDLSLVPGDSPLREFIGGSTLNYG